MTCIGAAAAAELEGRNSVSERTSKEPHSRFLASGARVSCQMESRV